MTNIHDEQNKIQDHSDPEANTFTKTVASIIAAGAITVFSISGAYLVVTDFQPNQTLPNTAGYCGEDDGDKPKAASNTCGEDKDGGGDNTIDA